MTSSVTDMRREELIEHLRTSPFRQFTIHLADQRSFLVDHPDYLLLPPQVHRLASWFERDEQRTALIDMAFITGLTLHDPVEQTE